MIPVWTIPPNLYKLLYKTISVISFKAREKEFFCKGSFAIQTVKNSRGFAFNNLPSARHKSILETFLALLSCYHLVKQKNSQSQAERLERKGK